MEPLNILCVDDERGMRLAIHHALEDYSYESTTLKSLVKFNVFLAENGEEALELLKQSSYNILLLDYKLPGINGLEVLEEIESRYPDMVTVVITAYASIETAIIATKRGAFDFIAKPFTPEELRAVVRKATEQNLLRQRTRQLETEKRQVRFQMVSVMAHELKAPINAIESYLQIFLNRTAGNELDAYDGIFNRCKVRLEGMRKLIGDLLDLTRLESQGLNRDLRELNAVTILEFALETVSDKAKQNKIEIEVQTPRPLMIVADSREMETIFNNLLSNAVKYNRFGGKVNVFMELNEGAFHLRVSDTGIGFNEQEGARLFSEFGRIRNEKTKNILGSGLGLSIIKKIVSLYGGDVQAKSKPHIGSTFTISLPCETSADEMA